ncbi:HisA/HisF-related TIM barrel protein [Labrys sp. ZIDIC5]|uniref:HisA/HisF-related TIM barrel protein n=1 Tax=Labrys sedimenti TaxID=3106036 RepID=UPI002ACA0475|nr:HisA/HisF-related TIM barrel protein [Labrys sp. ZIDIC5]MDZ5452281.1 HisA/HisF-related TIM barrel protein [Labrys sp. ZIDIC5]
MPAPDRQDKAHTAPGANLGVEIVPVIDLRHGSVVRAKAGDRARYQPIVTPLSPTADPVDVAAGLLRAAPSRQLYVADLDGIEGRGRDTASLRRLAHAFPAVRLWIDAGIATRSEAEAFFDEGLGLPVLGSESQSGDRLVRDLADHAVLSLDFRGDDYVGPEAILATPSIWPERVIVMTLGRVGMGSGPDLDRLSALRRQAPARCRLYAAGGLRDKGDLAALAEIGVSGILVASALHDGRL